MAELTVQDATETGVITFAAAGAGGDTFKNDGKTVLVCQNDDASSTTVTVTAQVTSYEDRIRGSLTKGNGGGAVAANDVGLFGPFLPSPFNNASGQVAVTYSSVTSLSVAAVRVG